MCASRCIGEVVLLRYAVTVSMSVNTDECVVSILPNTPPPRGSGGARLRRLLLHREALCEEAPDEIKQTGNGVLLQKLLAIKGRDLDEAVAQDKEQSIMEHKQVEENVKVAPSIVTAGRTVSKLARIATSLGLSPRGGVSQPAEASRPRINTTLAALLSPKRPVSYVGSPSNAAPNLALASAVAKSLVLHRGKEAFLGLCRSPRLSQWTPRSSAPGARSPRLSQWTPRSGAAGALCVSPWRRRRRADEEAQWLLYNPLALPPEQLVSPRQTLGDFFRLSGEERQGLLRLELERCGIPVEPSEGERRLEVATKAFLQVTRTGRRMVRASARAKLRRAMRKLQVVAALRAAAKGGAGAGPRRRTHKLHRVLYMPPLKRTWEDIDKLQAFLKTLRFFACFNMEELCSLARAVTLHKFTAEAVFNQGDPAGSFFVVLCGSASAFTTHELQCLGGVTSTEEPAGSYEEQDTIGLEACLCDLPRQSRVVADGRLELLQVSRDAYLRVARRMVDQRSSILRQVPALRLLPSEEIEVLAAAMELRTVPSGTHIWTQGEACDGRTAAVLVLHGELGIMQDLPPGHKCPTRRTRVLQQRLKASTKRHASVAAAPVAGGTQVLPTCTQRLRQDAAPGSKPFKLRVTPHDVFKTLRDGTEAASGRRQMAPRKPPERRDDGGGLWEEGRYYDVCLATVSLGMVLTTEEEQVREGEEGHGDMAGSSKTGDEKGRGAKAVAPASADDSAKPTRAFSLVAVGVAQVGVLSRGVVRQVMRRNRWAVGPLRQAEATAPPDHVLHSILRRRRWWDKYKRRHVAFHTGPTPRPPGNPSAPMLRESDSPSLADLRLSLSLTPRTQASSAASDSSTLTSTSTSTPTSTCSPVLRRCEVVLPLRVPADKYPLRRLHHLADDDPEVLDTHVGLLESCKRLVARPAPRTTWASKWAARLKRPSRLMRPAPAAAPQPPAAALPSPIPTAPHRSVRPVSQYTRNRPGRRLTVASDMHPGAASGTQGSVAGSAGDSRSTLSTEGVAELMTSRSESAASASTDTSVLLHVMLSEPSLDSSPRPPPSPVAVPVGTHADPEEGQWQPWTTRRQLLEGREQLAGKRSRRTMCTNTPAGLQHMLGAFVEKEEEGEEGGAESRSESGSSADGVERLVEAISPRPSQPTSARRASVHGTWNRPQPPKARLAASVSPRLVREAATRKYVSFK